MDETRWTTLEEAARIYHSKVETLRAFVSKGVIRNLEGTLYYSAEDIETVLAESTVNAILTSTFTTYQDLYANFGVKRGWLDRLVHRGVVRTRDGGALFFVDDVAAALRKDPDQIK